MFRVSTPFSPFEIWFVVYGEEGLKAEKVNKQVVTGCSTVIRAISELSW